ncbi:MAG: HpaII family restriction endonuclease [Oscillospiraceae bacterium]|nr:HpaII family restriction endonuclease [Oscillospiraceae bacterium]
MGITGNKGEWSELYVFLYLLGTGKLYAGDENLKRIDNMYFPVLKAFRVDQHRNMEFEINDATDIDIYINGHYSKTVKGSYLKDTAKLLYKKIVDGDDRSFEIPEASEAMHDLDLTVIKASSDDKTDITLQIHDVQTGYDPTVGFSIKSHIGGAPTLLNASGATNFQFQCPDVFDSTQMDNINSINTSRKIKDRIAAIGTLGEGIVKNGVFRRNLLFVDSMMEKILAEALKIHYSENIIFVSDVVKRLEEIDPVGYHIPGIYTHKFKKLLCAIALGLKPSNKWDGHDEANGGYIIATSDGNVIAFHIYNRDSFETYLINHTKFERASTTRHGYAVVYEENGHKYVDLNLQIRFI